MNIKHKIITFSILAALGLLLVINQVKKNTQNNTLKIGILQTASHPALDAVRTGFVEKLTAHFGSNVEFVVKNAEGNISHAHTIAQSFHADKSIAAILAIATPAVQAAANAEKEKPIIIAAVTDPHALGILETNKNITGTSDMIDVEKQVSSIRQILQEVKTVGIIFNTGEVNSRSLSSKMKVELKKQGITAEFFGITSETDLPAIIDSALRKTDALLAPTDNMVASSITIITNRARQAKKPFIASDNMLVEHGALMARGVDYHVSGHQAGKIALEILIHEKSPNQIPLTHAVTNKIFINKKVASELGVSIPKELSKEIVLV